MIATLDANAWAAALGRASWQGGLAALIVWSVCRLVPRIPARYQCWLWRLVILKFAIVLAWSAPIELPLLPAQQTSPAVASKPAVLPSSSVDVVPAVAEQPALEFVPSHWLIVILAWLTLVGWQTVRLAMDYRAAMRLRAGGRPSADRDLLDQLESVSQSFGFRKSPALLEMDGQGSPMLIGVLRPTIVAPAETLSRLAGSEREAVLAHELAHARRHDLFWGLVAAVNRTLFFFHPLAWLAERQLRLTQEIAADELAIATREREPVDYAALLVSIIGKLGPSRVLPAASVGAAGSHHSLKQRFVAMRYMKPISRRCAVAYVSLLAMVAAIGVVPWVLVAADVPTKSKEAPAAPEKTGTGRGQFVSFKDGMLTIRANDGALIKNKVSDNAKTFQWNDDGGFKPVGNDALNEVKAGTWFHIIVGENNVTIRIGARKAVTNGTVVSFKDNRLLILGKDLGPSYVAKYGNNVHFNKFRDDVPAYESIDGGEYKLIGTANKVLGAVKEGTIVAVHGEGDDNITLVQIGVPKKQ